MSDEAPGRELTAEMRQAEAMAKLPANLAVIRIENDTISSLAAAHPRDYETIKRDLLAQLDAFPSFAAEAIYAKPVGDGKIARGLSIRAAEAIAEAYGYCRVRSDVSPIDDDSVKVEATFVDYQRGRIWQDGGIVSKWYRAGKNKGGGMVKHADDRFYGVVVKAEISRRIREVITRSVPPGLRAELFDMAEQRMRRLLTPDKVAGIVKNFGGQGVTAAMLEAYIGRTVAAGWTEDDRINLLSTWNACKEGETTLADVFGEFGYIDPKAAAKPKAAAPTGPVTGADLSGAPTAQDNGSSTPQRVVPSGEDHTPVIAGGEAPWNADSPEADTAKSGEVIATQDVATTDPPDNATTPAQFEAFIRVVDTPESLDKLARAIDAATNLSDSEKAGLLGLCDKRAVKLKKSAKQAKAFETAPQANEE